MSDRITDIAKIDHQRHNSEPWDEAPADDRQLFLDEARNYIAAADEWDRANGIVRVDTRDPATVERVARALWDDDVSHESQEWRDSAWADMGGPDDSERWEYVRLARAVLAALEES